MKPKPPYYAVIFTTKAGDIDDPAYADAAAEILELAMTMPGYLGFESARDSELGIAVSYWDSLEAIAAWRDNARHTAVRERGRAKWYASYELRIAKVERHYGWSSSPATSSS